MITLDEAIEKEKMQYKIYKLEYEAECTFYGQTLLMNIVVILIVLKICMNMNSLLSGWKN